MMELDLKIVIFIVINFLIVVYILQRFLLKPVLKIIDARKNKLEDALKHAEQDRVEAKRLLDDTKYQTHMEQERLRAMITAKDKELKNKQAEAVEQLESIAIKQRRKAREDLMLERDRNLRTHQKEIVDLSANIAERLLKSSQKETIQQEQIDNFLDELSHADVQAHPDKSEDVVAATQAETAKVEAAEGE